MTRALFWKEWRSQRPLVLAGLAISIVQPLGLLAFMSTARGGSLLEDMVLVVMSITAACILPVFAAVIGANAFAADMGDGSLRFLLSRPVSRGRIWGIKLIAGVGAYVSLSVGLAVIALVFGSVAGLRLDEMVPGPRALWAEGTMLLVFTAVVLFLFTCAAYCSIFIHQAMTAALGAGVAGAAMGLALWLVWGLIEPSSPFSETLYGYGFIAALPLGALGMLGATYWAFCRGELFQDRQHRMWGPPLVVTAVVAVLAVPPALSGSLGGAARYAERITSTVALTEEAAVLTVRAVGGHSTSIVKLDAATGRRETVARHAMSPALSPDGSWIAYLSFGSPLGLLYGAPEVRAVRSNGSEDHLVIGGLSENWARSRLRLSVTPDGRHVALFGRSSRGSTVTLAPLDGEAYEPNTVSLPPLTDVVGWNADSSAELVHYRTSRGRTEIRALDLLSGRDRLVREMAVAPSLARYLDWSFGSAGAGEWLPLWLPEGEGDLTLNLLNVASGELEPVTDTPCRMWGLAGGLFVYGRCEGRTRQTAGIAELRIRDLRSGSGEAFGRVDGLNDFRWGRGMYLSPDGERMLMYARRGGASGSFVVARDGDVRQLPLGQPIGWLDNEAVLAYFQPWQDGWIGLFDLGRGELRTIVPQ